MKPENNFFSFKKPFEPPSATGRHFSKQVGTPIGTRNLLFNNVNFQSGKVQGILVDSRINTQFKTPFFDTGYIVITFKIPYYLNSSYFPKGLIYIQNVD